MDTGFRGFTRRSERRCRQAGTLQHSARAADETVLLHHPVLLEPTEVIDQVAFGEQQTDTATARIPDGTGDWSEGLTPTPGAAND